jgi:hypothetical protein
LALQIETNAKLFTINTLGANGVIKPAAARRREPTFLVTELNGIARNT